MSVATTTRASRPLLVTTARQLRTHLATAPGARGPLVLVPTMGALHEGHADLVRRARELAGEAGRVVVTVFVNPLQFGEGEDLDRYPRTLDDDLVVAGRAGADLVLAPSVDEVYPGGRPQVTVHPGPLGEVLEGAVRPGHFSGVLTVVTKLLGLVRPDVAVFGEKDFQQLTLVRRAVLDLALGVEVVGVPTRREDDGLALSSRNRYLDPAARRTALGLSAALRAGVEAGPAGADAVLAAARSALASYDGVAADYLVLTDAHLGPAPAAGEARLLVAARVGGTRLIDNLPVTLGPAPAAGTPAAPTTPDQSPHQSPDQTPTPTPGDTGEAGDR